MFGKCRIGVMDWVASRDMAQSYIIFLYPLLHSNQLATEEKFYQVHYQTIYVEDTKICCENFFLLIAHHIMLKALG